MELHQIDLNVLVLFNQIMVERRVSKVAENLDLTQPALSNALAFTAGSTSRVRSSPRRSSGR